MTESDIIILVFILFGIIGGLVLLRRTSELLIGKNSTDYMVGILAADAVKVVLKALWLPMRWLGRSFFRLF